jgi:hypothetical protein
MRLLFSFLFLLFARETFPQQIDYSKFKGENVSVSLKIRLSNPSLFEYSSRKGELNFFPITIGSKGLQGTSEELVSLYYKAQTKQEISQLAPSNAINKYSGFVYQKNDSSKNYLGLVHKLTFDFGGSETAIIKYFEFKDSVVIAYSSIQLQKNNDKWQMVSIKELDNIELSIRSLKTKYFWEFYNQSESTVSFINDLRKQARTENRILDIERLGQLIKSNKSKLKEYCDF